MVDRIYSSILCKKKKIFKEESASHPAVILILPCKEEMTMVSSEEVGEYNKNGDLTKSIKGAPRIEYFVHVTTSTNEGSLKRGARRERE